LIFAHNFFGLLASYRLSAISVNSNDRSGRACRGVAESEDG